MDIKEFKTLVKNRQACRSFTDEKIKKEDINEILDVALLAPSACNSQPWRVYCVTNDDKVKDVAACLQDNGFNAFTSKAQAFFVLAETSATLKPGISAKVANNKFVEYDIGELTAYITLAATAKGLDTCVIGWINQEKLKAALNLSDEEKCNIVIALGYGDAPLREKVRKPFNETVKFL